MRQPTNVFKHNGQTSEEFSSEKLKKTVFAACLNVRSPEYSAKSTTDLVCNDVEKWLLTKEEVTSLDIKDKATEFLEKYHPEAAYIYNQYSLTI